MYNTEDWRTVAQHFSALVTFEMLYAGCGILEVGAHTSFPPPQVIPTSYLSKTQQLHSHISQALF